MRKAGAAEEEPVAALAEAQAAPRAVPEIWAPQEVPALGIWGARALWEAPVSETRPSLL